MTIEKRIKILTEAEGQKLYRPAAFLEGKSLGPIRDWQSHCPKSVVREL